MNKFFSDIVKGFAFAIGFSLWMFGASYAYSLYSETFQAEPSTEECPKGAENSDNAENSDYNFREELLRSEERSAEIFKRTLERISNLEKEVDSLRK